MNAIEAAAEPKRARPAREIWKSPLDAPNKIPARYFLKVAAAAKARLI